MWMILINLKTISDADFDSVSAEGVNKLLGSYNEFLWIFLIISLSRN